MGADLIANNGACLLSHYDLYKDVVSVVWQTDTCQMCERDFTWPKKQKQI